ncbi:SH3 domain-containing protein [Exiguobacterium sp.]|uniref:SH3 domain-containing protein n=1 Tax=Exiguobacterium sp. TaxID=44751 RepID=UPI00307F01B5
MKSNLTRLSAAVLISTSLFSGLAPAPSYAATYEGTVNTEILNVRSDSSTTSSIVGKLTEGTTVNVYSSNNDWAQIEFEGQKRYVSSEYLTVNTSISKSSTSTATALYTAKEATNMYSSMTTSSSVVSAIPKGATITYISTHGATGSWYKVSYNGKTGYVAQKYFVEQASAKQYVAEMNVNLRAEMTTSSAILTVVPKDAVVDYISTHGATGSWYKVSYNGKIGYVAQKYFSAYEGGSVTPQVNPTHMTTDSTKVYASITTTSRVLTTLPKGAKVSLQSTYGATNSWGKISYNGITGYVAMRDLQSLTAPKPMYISNQTTLYNSMSSSKKAIRTLTPGTAVSQLSTHGATGSWSKVTYQSTTGYVPTRDLSEKFTQVVTPYYAQQETKLYSSMSSSKTVLHTIPKGAKVDQFAKFGATGSWYQVRYNNTTGYVAARDFALTPPTTTPTEQYGPEAEYRIYVEGGSTLNVRSTPAVQSDNLAGTLNTGTIVSVKPIIGSDWGLLTNGTYSGNYIHMDYAIPVTTTPPGSGVIKNVFYTSYPMTVREMAQTQFNVAGVTDAHRHKDAYLPRAWVNVNGSTGMIIKNEMKVVSNVSAALKSSASSNSVTLATVPRGATVTYIERASNSSWYKVKYGATTGYITLSSVLGTANVLSSASLTSHPYGQINPGEQVNITGQTGTYYKISYSRPSGFDRTVFDNIWRRATLDEITSYVDPNRIDVNSQSFYQFLDLSKSAGTTANTLNKFLSSKGTLSGKGQAFVDAANMLGVNEVYLLSHALLETAHGTSLLATGIPVDKDGNALINSSGNRIYPERPVAATVYNMYGIQAVDSNPLGSGAKYAFEQKWFSPNDAIIGGAEWISNRYINDPRYKRNTLYKMRFNPDAPGTYQYATDIGWAAKQTKNIFDIYQSLDAYTLNFDVPKYQ